MAQELRLNQGIKMFVHRTPNISLYYNDVNTKTDKIYNKESTEELLLEYQTSEGDKKLAIRNKIIELNLRLVISVARKNCSPEDNLLDLIEEGNIGLIKAVDKYDVNKESCFAKLAIYYITGAIRYYKLHNASVVSIKNKHRTYGIVRKITNEYLQRENRKPTCEELMDEYNKRASVKYNVQEDFLETKIIGIDIQFSNPDSSPYETSKERVDFTNKTCSFNGSEDVIENDHKKSLIKTYLQFLSPRDSEIMKMVYGLDGYEREFTYKEIAQKMNVTKERIRQIHVRSLEVLKEKLIPNYSNNGTHNG
jgi:RNA polymerase primary sigma factor